MQCLHPYEKPDGRTFACGHCINCKVNRTTEWAARLLHEYAVWPTASFVTFTYDDLHIPPNYSLRSKDMTDFWKRLRRDLEYEGRNIKYFYCGEYGDQFQRPHYHAIVFGLNPGDEHDRNLIIDNWPLCERFIFRRKLKHNAIDVVTPDDIRYVAGYVQKKLYGKLAEKEYKDTGRIAPYARMSKGIGLEFARKNEKQIREMQCIKFKTRTVPIPRYYREKLEIDVNDLDFSKCKSNSFYVNYNAAFDLVKHTLINKYGKTFYMSRAGQRMTQKLLDEVEQSYIHAYELKQGDFKK